MGGTRYYYGGGSYPYYGYYSGWPYSNRGYGTYSGYYPYSYRGGYPHSGYNNYYSLQWLQLRSGASANSVTTTA